MKNNKIDLDILSCIFLLGILVIPIMFALISYQPKLMDNYEEDTEVVIEETEKIEAVKINAEIIEESETTEEIIEEEIIKERKLDPADFITAEKYLTYKESEVISNTIVFTVVYDGSLSKLDLENNINSLSIKLKNFYYAEQTYESVRIMVVKSSKNDDLVIYACENGVSIFNNM